MKPYLCVLSLLSLAVLLTAGCKESSPAKSQPAASNPQQPSKPVSEANEEAEIAAYLAKLSPEDRKLAEAQRFCPVSDERLGTPSMGTPVKIMVKTEPVFLCCKTCTRSALEDADKTLAKVKELKENAAELAKLSPQDRLLAEAQKVCPITDEPLGSMGEPIKIMLKGEPVFLCCKGCTKDAQKEPDKIIEKVKKLKAKNK